MTSEKRRQKFHTDDASLPRSEWCSRLVENLHHPIRSTTQIWIVTRHQYGISAIVCQTSFRAETSGGVAKCRLFSQATRGSSAKKRANSKPLSYKLNIFYLSIQSLNSMSPALSNFNNTPRVGSDGSEPPSKYRTTITLSLNTTDESFRDVYHLSKGLHSRD